MRTHDASAIEPGATPKEDQPEAAACLKIDPGQTANEGSSASEQMEDFENELKETDWGHQPC